MDLFKAVIIDGYWQKVSQEDIMCPDGSTYHYLSNILAKNFQLESDQAFPFNYTFMGKEEQLTHIMKCNQENSSMSSCTTHDSVIQFLPQINLEKSTD